MKKIFTASLIIACALEQPFKRLYALEKMQAVLKTEKCIILLPEDYDKIPPLDYTKQEIDDILNSRFNDVQFIVKEENVLFWKIAMKFKLLEAVQERSITPFLLGIINAENEVTKITISEYFSKLTLAQRQTEKKRLAELIVANGMQIEYIMLNIFQEYPDYFYDKNDFDGSSPLQNRPKHIRQMDTFDYTDRILKLVAQQKKITRIIMQQLGTL